MTAVATGFPVQPVPSDPGIWIGAEDFSRFNVGAGTPAVDVNGEPGLRMWPTDSLSTEIRNDPAEGNYFIQTGTNANHMLIETFSDIFRYGEVLCRILLDTSGDSGSRIKTSPNIAVWEHANSWFYTQMATFSNTMRLTGDGRQPSANTAQVNYGTLGPNLWFWVRQRITDAGGGDVRIQIHPTFSDYDNPPDVPMIWDIDEVVTWASLAPGAWGSRQGWIRVTSGPTQQSDRAISFYSFSTDPTFTTPPPLPEEVADTPGGTIITVPTLVSPPDPLQGTYVGLTGSAFEQEVLAGAPEVSAIPGIISDPLAIACWEHRYWNTQFDQRQWAHQDLSGKGQHLYWGDRLAANSILGDGPFSGGIRGIVHGGTNGKTLGIANTGQQLNAGAAGETVRVTLNFTMDLTHQVIQTLISHDESTVTKAFRFEVQANTAIPQFFLTENGSTDRGGAADTALSTVFSDWDNMWLRATFNFTTDQITLETSSDGVIWSSFASPIAFGADLAGMFQPADTAPLWLGSINDGTQNSLQMGAIYYVLIEEDSGGFSTVFEQDFAAFTRISTLQESVNQNVEPSGSPDIQGLHSVRIDLSNSGHMGTWFSTFQTAINDVWNVGVGEVLTFILVSEVDWIIAGGGAPTDAAIFGKKQNRLAASAGYGVESVTATSGVVFYNSDGATQDASPLTLVPYPVNWDLNAVIFEIDGPAGEIRMRRGSGGVPEISSYNNLGTGSVQESMRINGFNAQGVNEQDFLGAFGIKKILTIGEMNEVVEFLSSGRLS